MGIAIGIVLVGATIASFVMINARAGKMARQYRDDGQWTVDPHTGQPVPPQDSSHHGAGNHGGGHDGGGFSGGGGHHG
jgi:uncharacterized membrane protein YgcG